MEDPLFFQQCRVDPLDEFSEIASSIWEDFHNYSCKPQQTTIMDFKRPAPESSQIGEEMPLKQLKTPKYELENMWIKSPPSTTCTTTAQVVSSSFIWPSSPSIVPIGSPSPAEPKFLSRSSFLYPIQEDYKSNNITLSKASRHVLAERKRREKLSQKFAALCALVPGLSKLINMDKASILRGAIEHMKQLQGKVNILEKQKMKKASMEFAVKKYELYCSSSDESFSGGPINSDSLPQIEARLCNDGILISVHCERRKGMLEKVGAEINKLHLSVVNSSVMAYGNSALNITVIAQKDEQSKMSTKELVNNLRLMLRALMSNRNVFARNSWDV